MSLPDDPPGSQTLALLCRHADGIQHVVRVLSQSRSATPRSGWLLRPDRARQKAENLVPFHRNALDTTSLVNEWIVKGLGNVEDRCCRDAPAEDGHPVRRRARG